MDITVNYELNLNVTSEMHTSDHKLTPPNETYTKCLIFATSNWHVKLTFSQII